MRSDRHLRHEDDGLALGIAVKYHAFGVPLMRIQDSTAPLGQARKTLMPCLPKNGGFPATSYETS